VTRLLPFFVIAAAAATPAFAQDDTQVWTGFTASGPVAGAFALYGEAQFRFGDDISELSQSVLRGGIGWQPRGGLAFYGGYARQTTYRQGGPDTQEHRLWQQASYPIGDIGRLHLTGRTRAEQRRTRGGGDWAWRLRQQIKAALPVRRESDIRLVGAVELMLNVNDTDWGVESGLDQLRSFAGINLPLAEGLTLETGYLNQYQRRAAGPDRMNHIASFSFAYRFGQ
jgi:hypothetical protein